jgi:hypothetical protein
VTVANRNDENGISRREFATRVGAAAAGIAVGGELFTGQAEAGHDAAADRAIR